MKSHFKAWKVQKEHLLLAPATLPAPSALPCSTYLGSSAVNPVRIQMSSLLGRDAGAAVGLSLFCVLQHEVDVSFSFISQELLPSLAGPPKGGFPMAGQK